MTTEHPTPAPVAAESTVQPARRFYFHIEEGLEGDGAPTREAAIAQAFDSYGTASIRSNGGVHTGRADIALALMDHLSAILPNGQHRDAILRTYERHLDAADETLALFLPEEEVPGVEVEWHPWDTIERLAPPQEVRYNVLYHRGDLKLKIQGEVSRHELYHSARGWLAQYLSQDVNAMLNEYFWKLGAQTLEQVRADLTAWEGHLRTLLLAGEAASVAVSGWLTVEVPGTKTKSLADDDARAKIPDHIIAVTGIHQGVEVRVIERQDSISPAEKRAVRLSEIEMASK